MIVIVSQPQRNYILRLSYLGLSVREAQFYISDSYMQGVYDSCKSVSNPATGELAMDIMCAGATGCSARK